MPSQHLKNTVLGWIVRAIHPRSEPGEMQNDIQHPVVRVAEKRAPHGSSGGTQGQFPASRSPAIAALATIEKTHLKLALILIIHNQLSYVSPSALLSTSAEARCQTPFLRAELSYVTRRPWLTFWWSEPGLSRDVAHGEPCEPLLRHLGPATRES